VSTFDVAIIGGGLIGVSSALELAAHNLRVVVLDRQQPGRESSWAAAGMLAPGTDMPEGDVLVPLARESFALYPEFVAAIEQASGQSSSFELEGTLEIFVAPSAETARNKFVAERHRSGLKAEPITAESARRMEPALGAAAEVAAWVPEEGIVDPRSLMDAALAAARNRGVESRSDCRVESVQLERGRCTGVVAGGNKISASHVVVTAGCFSAGIDGGIAQYAPTKPVRGQMVSLRHRDTRLTRTLRSENGYVVPRRDGRIMAGSTLEDAGFEKNVTPAGLLRILAAAVELVPSLAAAEILETWSGLRPGTPDHLPILGPTDIEGLVIATGHYRNGILLAPVTAKLVREWITTGRASLNVEAFSPLRFQRAGAESTHAAHKAAQL